MILRMKLVCATHSIHFGCVLWYISGPRKINTQSMSVICLFFFLLSTSTAELLIFSLTLCWIMQIDKRHIILGCFQPLFTIFHAAVDYLMVSACWLKWGAERGPLLVVVLFVQLLLEVALFVTFVFLWLAVCLCIWFVCVCVCVCECVCACVHAHMHACIYGVWVCVRACAHACMHLWCVSVCACVRHACLHLWCVCVCACVRTCMHAFMVCVCVSVCMRAHMHACIYGVCVWVCVHACNMHACIYGVCVCMRAHMHACIYGVCVCVFMSGICVCVCVCVCRRSISMRAKTRVILSVLKPCLQISFTKILFISLLRYCNNRIWILLFSSSW